MNSDGRRRRGAGTGERRRGPALIAALAAVVAVAVVAGFWLSGDDARGDELPATPIPPEEDPGPMHIHGLGVNPADDLLYAATHFGLWRVTEQDALERVGDAAHDFMGFTVVGEDHFLASGHPLLSEDLPSLLGLIESTDGGHTWHEVSLLGSADFHALRAEHGLVYGWNSADGVFMVSEGGGEWERRSSGPIVDFVVSPEFPDMVLATFADEPEELRTIQSTDGGRTWSGLDTPELALLEWSTPERLWAVAPDGQVWHSGDAGGGWEQRGALGGHPEALLDTGDVLYAAVDSTILRSDDDGASWTEVGQDGG